MDGEPVTPSEDSPLKKGFRTVSIFLVAAFLLVVVIITFVQAAKYQHAGNVIVGLGLLFFILATFLVYRWIPHDTIDERVLRAIYFQAGVVVFISIGVLIMAYQTTPCAPCPDCPTCPAQCTISNIPEGKWARAPQACYPGVQKNISIAISMNDPPKCPVNATNEFEELFYIEQQN